MEIFEEIFGVGKNLTIAQMSARGFVLFFISLALIRIAGMRSIGKGTAFDTVITIMLGAVLSRAVVGVSEFWPTLSASAVIVITHRVVAWVSLKSTTLEKIVKGQRRQLYKSGEIIWHNMNRSSVSKNDLLESMRLQANTNNLEEIEEAYMESNGKISIIKKK